MIIYMTRTLVALVSKSKYIACLWFGYHYSLIKAMTTLCLWKGINNYIEHGWLPIDQVINPMLVSSIRCI